MKIIDNLSFGDILLVDYEFTDGKGSKLRPILFLFSEKEDYTILKMTSQEAVDDKYSIEIKPDIQNNLRSITYVKIKKITTFHESLFARKIGSLSLSQKKKIKSLLEDIIYHL
ncbi:MAG: type II toxin-antitoxin system PemK/MazF family toxin [Candidatus Absconditabacteria bacterium]|nr:type II toxin-antitoxin system PemK/MazF family toxin [Candidatus Absconditabacteria bacterium]